MARIPIALQLYSVRDDCAKDLAGTLENVAKMGYEGVEFAGYHGRTAKELRTLLDGLNLKVAGTHIGLDTLLGDEFEKTVAFNREIGNKHLIVPGLSEERRNSAQAWLDTAGVFNELAAKLAQFGMKTGYHNHWIEFQPMDGKLPWDIFFGNTTGDVIMQLDTGNALHGGADPIALLERYPGRAETVHLKEYSGSYDKALIGEGEIDWERVFALCEASGGTEWYIVEQENYALPPLECVDKCLQNLKKMGK